MKKLWFLLGLLCMAALLTVGVFAADDFIVSVSVAVETPKAGDTPKDALLGETAVVAVVDGGRKDLVPHVDFDVVSYFWKEKDTGLILGDEELFVSGRTYIFEAEMEFITELPVTGETAFSVDGKGITPAQKGEKWILSCEFLAIPENFEPKVSLTVMGEKRKEFDGEGITLTALVEEVGGISYEYAWYRDMIPVEGATENTFTVRDVSQSGKYLCAVTARVTADPTIEPKVTRTTAHDVEITPTAITLQIENAEKNLYDPDPKFTYTVLGNVCDPLYGSPQRLEGEDIGKYSILIGSLTFAENKIQNYQIIVKQGTLTILAADELPFSAVANIADVSYISGAQKAKIRATASKGSIPDGALLSFTTASSEARADLSSALGKSIMKSFAVKIVSKDGKELSLPKHGAIRLQIPLTEDEAKLDMKTVTAGFFAKTSKFLETEVVESEGVTYLSVQIETLGVVALFDGEEKAAPSDKNEGPKDTDKEEGSTWLWILIASVSLLAVGGIVFTVIVTVKNKKPSPKVDKDGVKTYEPAPKKKEGKKEEPLSDPLAKALSSNEDEKKKQRKIAEELNEKPVDGKEKPKKKAGRTVVSFEDLED